MAAAVVSPGGGGGGASKADQACPGKVDNAASLGLRSCRSSAGCPRPWRAAAPHGLPCNNYFFWGGYIKRTEPMIYMGYLIIINGHNVGKISLQLFKF